MQRRPWTDDELDLLRTMYPDRPTKEIADKLGRTITTVYRKAAQFQLHKSPEFLASPLSGILRKGEVRPEGVPFQFKRGQDPYNKGLRRPGWSPGRMKQTQFKKGQRSGRAAENWKPIGTILPDHEGYLRIKVREAEHGIEATGFGNTKVWPLLHRHIWEQHKGPIPVGDVITFKNGNRRECEINNLERISRADLARRNSMWSHYPRELAETIQLTGALKRKIKRYEKHHGN